MELSVVIVNWNTRGLLARCLDSISDLRSRQGTEVIVVDNASCDGSPGLIRKDFSDVILVENEHNLGFARANNQGMRIARGKYSLLLNSDAFPRPGAVEALIQLAEEKPRAGIVGGQLLNPDGSFQASHTPFPGLCQEFLNLSGLGRLIKGPWYPSSGPDSESVPRVVDYVEGACMLVRREAYEQVGGLDEGYFMYAEEVDWCFSMRQKGWQTWYQPSARVVHLGGGSSRTRMLIRETDLYVSRMRFFKKHYRGGEVAMLRLQLYVITAIKNVVHGFLRLVTRGRLGRQVVSVGNLHAALRKL